VNQPEFEALKTRYQEANRLRECIENTEKFIREVGRRIQEPTALYDLSFYRNRTQDGDRRDTGVWATLPANIIEEGMLPALTEALKRMKAEYKALEAPK